MTPAPALSHTPSELRYYNSTESSSLQVSVSLVSSTVDTTDGLDWDVWNDQIQPFDQAANLIWNIGDPLLSVFGTFGNVMIVLIMLRLPASTSSVFFQVLAWSDQLLLVIDPVSYFLFYTHFNLRRFQELGSWQCKMYTMTLATTSALSPWMLVALAMLRAASVLWPLRVNAAWTKRKSRFTAAIMVVVISLIHCHSLYGFDIGSCSSTCCSNAVSETYAWFDDIVYPWIDRVESYILPFILLGVSNTVLLWTLVSSFRTGTHLVRKATQDSRQQQLTSLTVTVIATSIAFFLLTAPFITLSIISPYINWDDPIQNGQYRVFRAVSVQLLFANNAVNFYLYCLTGTKFRAEFKKIIFGVFCLFCKKNKVNDRDAT